MAGGWESENYDNGNRSERLTFEVAALPALKLEGQAPRQGMPAVFGSRKRQGSGVLPWSVQKKLSSDNALIFSLVKPCSDF